MDKVLERKESATVWNTTVMRKILANLIAQGDLLESNFAYAHEKKEQSKKFSKNFYENNKQSKFYENKKFQSKNSENSHITNATIKNFECLLCGEKHKVSQCNKYPTAIDKVNQAKKINLCTRCLSKGHSSKNCRTEKDIKCYHCENKHYSFFCLKKNNNKNQKANSSKSHQTNKKFVTFDSSSNAKNSENTQLNNSVTNSVNTKTENDIVNASINPSLESSKETVLFMCIQCEVSNPTNPNSRIKANVFLDGMSFRTFISEKLSKSLELNSFAKECLSFCSFGSDSPSTENLDRVCINLFDEFGSKIKVNGNVKKFLTASAPACLIKNEDIKNIENLHVKWLKPDIIIGMDNYHLFCVKELRRLTDRLVLSETKLGLMISGSLNPSPSQKTNSKFFHPNLCNGTIGWTENDESIDSLDLKFNDFFLQLIK
jgi:hypothetical protein